ncbi:PKD domain-containing protein [Geothrix sp.]|jgi:PKD repeat protein|uniref:PKD domain-containing protein n=1 Tax=Geothrix sp. TaxID=1962974 RepID=UPI0025B8526A|nr:PKD domain-containing protein [Geothrix sp.]
MTHSFLRHSMNLATLAGAALVLPVLHCGKSASQAQTASSSQPAPGASAAPFSFSVVASGLSKPTGIALADNRSLVISQQPAAPLDASLARIDLGTGSVGLIAGGAAVQSGFAANRAGRLYWVDAQKGALMTQSRAAGSPTVLHAGGMLPTTTIAVDAANRVYLAGTAAQGGNGVAAVLVRGASPTAIPDPSGPDKTVLVAASSGDLYWTSRAAGLIYHRSPDGKGSVLVTGLKSPQGLALGPAEDVLYFTEVPTPGKDAAAGGTNTVSALDLATLSRTVIHRGDPEPTGVAVAANGSVYWTSTSRGLVLVARPAILPAAPAQFTATLSGTEEVPPVTTQASGKASFSFVSGTTLSDDQVSTGPALGYRVTITGIARVRRIEIHQGAKGTTGPLVAILPRGDDFDDDEDELTSGRESGSGGMGGFALGGRIRLQNLLGPYAGDWAGFSAALAAGNLYLTVPTRSYPTGEIRGQILPTAAPPANHPPTAVITSPAADATIQAGQSVTFAGTATDPDGDAVSILWDFGDGSSSTLLSPGSHTYAMAGTYTVRLTATDAYGLADPNPPTRTITVQPAAVNLPPSATITSPSGSVSIVAGQSVTFAGTASDPNGDPVTVLWEFGDGGTSTLLAPGAHAYATAGTYTARLTATDSHGLPDPNPPTRTITVTAAPVNQPPTATIIAPATNVTINAGQSVTFTGTASDPDGDAVTVLWTFGDGTTSTLLAPGSHTFAAPGTYTVRLTATDSHGLVDPNPPVRTITVSAVAAPTLTQIQTQIFTPLCVGCHDAAGAAGMNLTAGSAYANLVNVPATTLPGLRVVPGDPASSALVIQLASGHRNVSAANQSLISAWITAGALNN